MKTILDPRTTEAILRDSKTRNKAEIFDDSNSSLFEIQTITLDLTTAKEIGNPYRINMPLRSIFVREASDGTTSVNFFPSTVDTYQSAAKLTLNDSIEFGRQLATAALTWDAQPGKSVTLVLFVSSFFRSGSQVSQNAGGVSISDGTAATDSCVSTTATTVLTCFTQNTTRKKGTIQNATGGSIFVGPLNTVSNTGANRGFEIVAGGVFYWRNTAALYAYPAATSTNGLFLREEV